MENSYHDTNVFSEEAKQLKQFLLELEGGHESQSVLKDIESFLFDPDNRWRLKQDDISKSFLFRSFFARRYRKQGVSPPLFPDQTRLPLLLLPLSADPQQNHQ